MAKNAANYLADLVVPAADQTTSASDSSVESGSEGRTFSRAHVSASSASEGEEDSADESDGGRQAQRLETITISIDQLCRKLKTINPHFTYSMINDNDDWSPEHDTDNLSSVKRQRNFCEQNIAEFVKWRKQTEDTTETPEAKMTSCDNSTPPNTLKDE